MSGVQSARKKDKEVDQHAFKAPASSSDPIFSNAALVKKPTLHAAAAEKPAEFGGASSP